jgi:hypothetical protein
MISEDGAGVGYLSHAMQAIPGGNTHYLLQMEHIKHFFRLL